MQFHSKTPHFQYLHQKWTAKNKKLQENLWSKHTDALKQLAAGSIGGLMLISSPLSVGAVSHNLIVSSDSALDHYDHNVLLAEKIKDIVPSEVRPLDLSEEAKITEILSDELGFKATAQMDGIRLNSNYGIIGGEQHLYRYPGDNIFAHADSSIEWAKYGGAGIAPNLGAWGYFSNSKEEFSEKDKMREKYYLAIQTFLTPGFVENVGKYRDFFKFRKMVVVNPKGGQVVVAVIGDAGPSEFTGKHLGGSPEVMDALGFGSGSRKGEVLYFFVDDPEDKIPLGAVKVQSRI